MCSRQAGIISIRARITIIRGCIKAIRARIETIRACLKIILPFLETIRAFLNAIRARITLRQACTGLIPPRIVSMQACTEEKQACIGTRQVVFFISPILRFPPGSPRTFQQWQCLPFRQGSAENEWLGQTISSPCLCKHLR